LECVINVYANWATAIEEKRDISSVCPGDTVCWVRGGGAEVPAPKCGNIKLLFFEQLTRQNNS